MYSYYIDKGFALEYLINLDYDSKIFFRESMLYRINLENKKWGAS